MNNLIRIAKPTLRKYVEPSFRPLSTKATVGPTKPSFQTSSTATTVDLTNPSFRPFLNDAIVDPTKPSLRLLSTTATVDPTKPKFVTRKAKEHENRITVIRPDNSVSIMELMSAHNLAIKQELRLVKIEDANVKTRRPVYKLMTNSEYYEGELKRRKDKKEERQSMSKGDKLVTISSRIGQHDLMTRVKQTVKWLEKGHEVRIVITGDKEEGVKECDDIYNTFASSVSGLGKILQKRTKGNSLRFQIVKDSADKNCENATSQNNSGSPPVNNCGKDKEKGVL